MQCNATQQKTTWVTQHPPVHHPKHPVLGFHRWDETVPPAGGGWSFL
jgi:hypothetical protein